MDIFYYVMNYSSKGIIDTACSGAFKRKSVEEVNQHIEDLAKSNYKAPSETLGSNNRLRGGGIKEINNMLAIEAKMDALMNKMSNQERRNQSAHRVGTMKRGEKKSLTDEGLSHEGPYQVEEARFVNGNRSYHFNPNTNLLTHCTPALRNDENFSYGIGVQQV